MMTDHEFRVWCEAHRLGVMLAEVARKGIELAERGEEWERRHEALKRLYLADLRRVAEIVGGVNRTDRGGSAGGATTPPV